MTDQLKRAINAATPLSTNAATTGTASGNTEEQTFDMSESSYKTSHTAIRKARRFVLQGLYEWLMTDHRFEQDNQRDWKANAPHDIAARTRATNAMHTVHLGYYHEMMRDIPEHIDALDALISQHLDRDLDKLDVVEHAILLIGAYELKNRLEVPYKVVLDEAMKLNNHFGATDAHKLINAVLDKMASELRAIEVQADVKAGTRTPVKAAIKSEKNTKATPAAETTAQPASNKPRISANNKSVKRDRPNKTNANISPAQAVAEHKAKQQAATSDSTKTDTASHTDDQSSH